MSRPTKPLIAVTPWRRSLPTVVRPNNDLYTIDPEYIDSVERAGGQALMVGFSTDVDDAMARLAPFDAVLFSGGEDIHPAMYGAEVDGAVGMSPATDASDAAYLAAAVALGLPVLGVCRGIHLINVALGGTLHQHVWGSSPEHPSRNQGPDESANANEMLARRHVVQLEPGSLVAKLFDADAIEANSLHHQAVDCVADDLVVTGRAHDGIVEVVEHRNHPLMAVQWHPELLPETAHDALFGWLVEAATAA